MTVRELISKLQKCNPDTIVWLGMRRDADINQIISVKDGDDEMIYLSDDTRDIIADCKNEGYKIKEIK